MGDAGLAAVSPEAKVLAALRRFVEAELATAYWNHWPLADCPRPVALTARNRAPMDREWRRADWAGYRRWQLGAAALAAYEAAHRPLRRRRKVVGR